MKYLSTLSSFRKVRGTSFFCKEIEEIAWLHQLALLFWLRARAQG